jgi:sugar phosphate isomerase/epimerase
MKAFLGDLSIGLLIMRHPHVRESALNSALRATLFTTVAVLFSPLLAWAGESPGIVAKPSSTALTNAFFAMDTGTRGTPAEVAAMLGEIGYAGLGGSGYNVKPMRQALEARGLKLFNVYLTLKLDPTHSALTPPMKQLITDLAGSGAALWIALDKVSNGGAPLPPSSTEGDALAVEKLRELADYAGPRGVRIALYPHTWFWLERTSDAVRLANRLNHPGVGVTFNLCHWLKVEGGGDAEATLRAAMPRLFFVSINGADGGETQKLDWKQLIQTLDRGTYEVGALLQTLRRLGYAGPIGLQAYGIGGEPRDNLTRSIEAWKRLSAAAANRPQTKLLAPVNLRFVQ